MLNQLNCSVARRAPSPNLSHCYSVCSGRAGALTHVAADLLDGTQEGSLAGCEGALALHEIVERSGHALALGPPPEVDINIVVGVEGEVAARRLHPRLGAPIPCRLSRGLRRHRDQGERGGSHL